MVKVELLASVVCHDTTGITQQRYLVRKIELPFPPDNHDFDIALMPVDEFRLREKRLGIAESWDFKCQQYRPDFVSYRLWDETYELISELNEDSFSLHTREKKEYDEYVRVLTEVLGFTDESDAARTRRV
jgi:hypothetical protein